MERDRQISIRQGTFDHRHVTALAKNFQEISPFTYALGNEMKRAEERGSGARLQPFRHPGRRLENQGMTSVSPGSSTMLSPGRFPEMIEETSIS
jgi:hypothetical protein